MWNRPAAVLLVSLALPTAAQAGACCVGTTTTVPTRVGPCEKWVAGIGLGLEAGALRWNNDGHITPSSLDEAAIISTAAAAYRWDRKGQIAVTMPVRGTWRGGSGMQSVGGGLGDARLDVAWSPVEEQMGKPTPYFVGGVRLPTGRAWEQSKDPLLADVTGLSEPAVHVLAQIERTMGDTPWAIGLNTELDIDADGVSPSFSLTGAIGRYIGSTMSITATAEHLEQFRGARAATTSLGGQVAVGKARSWRTWIGLQQDVPAPWLGRDRMVMTRVGGGFAILR